MLTAIRNGFTKSWRLVVTGAPLTIPAGPHYTPSFDVFDTLLTRLVSPPQAVFLLLGRSLASEGKIPCSAESFARARFAAELRAFTRAGGQDSDIGLPQIYLELLDCIGLSDDVRVELVRREEQLEEELLIQCPTGVEYLKRWRSHHPRAIFISDMYLSKAFIRRQLARHGLLLPGDHCYISSDCAASKSTGSLFDHVLSLEDLPAPTLVHHGDDIVSDVRVPRRKGIGVVHVPNGRSNRYERILGDYAFRTDGLSAVFAGASKVTRLNLLASTDHGVAIRDVAAGVAAPILVGYSLWLLRHATNLRLTKLYFLSRDGQVLQQIVESLARRMGIDIDCRYLFGSRKSWNLASFDSDLDKDFRWIWTHRNSATPSGLLGILGIEPHQVSATLNDIGIAPDMWNRSIDTEMQARLEFELVHGSASSVLDEHIYRSRSSLTSYLNHIDALESERIGLVDLGGIGSQLQAFNLLRSSIGIEPAALFLGYREQNPYSNSDEDSRRWLDHPPKAYLFDATTNQGVDRFAGMIPFLEAFCAADHGTVLGYQAEGPAAPILEFAESQALHNWGLKLHRDALHGFTRSVLLDSRLVDLDADVREATMSALRCLVHRPSMAESSAWGSFPFEVAPDGAGVISTLASPYGSMHPSRFLGDRNNREWFSWREGSLSQSRFPLGLAFRMMLAGESVLGRLGNRLAGATKACRPG